MKTKVITFTQLFVFMCFVACSGTPLIDATNSSLSGDLKTLHVHVLHHGTEVADAFPDLTTAEGYREFTNDLGITVTLKKAGLSWGDVELISEGDDEDCVPGLDTSVATGVIENILDADATELMIAGANIADAEYCQYTVNFTAANAASDGVDAFPEISGSSAHVSGSWSDGVNSGDFEIHVGHDMSVTLAFQSLQDDGSVSNHPFHFHGDDTEAMLMLGTHYDQWFNGIDFTEDSHDLEHELKDNIEASVEQYFEESTH